MEYTVQKLGRLAGVSGRTLRYYDEIELLKPSRINTSGYRIYGEIEVDRLQQILFYRELDMNLEDISYLMNAPTFDGRKALEDHHHKLLTKREQLNRLIATVEKTIDASEGRSTMSNKDKFQGFKQKIVNDNEVKYGKELRAKYGDNQVDQSNKKILNISEEDHQEVMQLAADIKAELAKAFAVGDPSSETAQNAVDMHRRWLSYYWDQYSPEYHVGLGEMYVGDERFKEYYDAIAPGVAEFLREAIYFYTTTDKVSH